MGDNTTADDAPTSDAALPAPRGIGKSEEGRPIRAYVIGDADRAAARLLVLAGQHGDEPLAREAAATFARRFADSPAARTIALAVIPDANPDGAARQTRHNARGVDLNRDHQQLATAETRAIHALARAWRPDVVADVHTYPPRRRHLLARGLVHCHDMLMDAASNPAANAAWPGEDDSPSVLASLLSDLRGAGYRAGRYVLIDEHGNVRHSTPDVLDARNGLALRLGVPSLLIEGRQPTRFDGPAEHARTRSALVATLEALARGLVVRHAWFGEPTEPGSVTPDGPKARACIPLTLDGPLAGCPERVARGGSAAGDDVPIRARYVTADGPYRMPFADAETNRVADVTLPGVYRGDLTVTARVRAPIAYAVPRDCEQTLRVLRAHGFAEQAWPAGRRAAVESYALVNGMPPAGHSPRAAEVAARRDRQVLDEYVVFPASADGGRALVVHLEPHSKYGLVRWLGVELVATAGVNYGVLRVLQDDVAT